MLACVSWALWGRCSSCQSVCVCVCVCVYEMQFKDVSMFPWRWILWKSNVWKSGLRALHIWMFRSICVMHAILTFTIMGNVQYSVALHFCIPYFFSSTFGKSYLWEIKCVGHVSVFHWVWLFVSWQFFKQYVTFVNILSSYLCFCPELAAEYW